MRSAYCVLSAIAIGVSAVGPVVAQTNQSAGRLEFGASYVVPRATVMQIFEQHLAGSRLYLHNLGDGPTSNYWKPNASMVRLGRHGTAVSFTIPSEAATPTRARAYRYFVNDIAANRFTVAAHENRVRLTVGFESEGPEFVGRCTTKPLSWWWQRIKVGVGAERVPAAELPTKRCAGLGSDAWLPQLHWDEPSLQIDFTMFAAQGGALELRVEAVDVRGHVRFEGTCAPRGMCEAAERIIRIAQARVATEIKARLDDKPFRGRVRAALGQAVRAQNPAFSWTRIRSANFQNGDLVVSVAVDATALKLRPLNPRDLPTPQR